MAAMSVLALAERAPAASTAAPVLWTTQVCSVVWAYYLAARGQRLLLPHAELSPAVLAGVLPNLLLFEMQDADTHRIRLCGTAYRGWFGADLTGRNWLQLSHPHDLVLRQRRLAQAALQPCGIQTRIWQFRDGLPRRKFEALTLPLAPRREGGAAVMLVAMADLAGSEDESDLIDLGQFRRVDWSFLDLGNGVPDSAGW
jgi:hypothetical protein